MPTLPIFFNATDYGTLSDGVPGNAATNTQTIKDAIAAVAVVNGVPTGGIVLLPAGRFYINGNIEMPDHVQIVGVGHGVAPSGPDPTVLGGTWLLIAWNSGQNLFTPITMKRGAQLRGVAFHYEHDAPTGSSWAPRIYPQTIQVDGDDCVIQDVYLLNSYDGIFVGKPTLNGEVMKNAGRVFIDRVHGQPFHSGVVVYCSLDVARITNTHFWPYWSGDARVTNYTRDNGAAFISVRNDNVQFVNCFAFAYYTGFRFAKLTGQYVAGPDGQPVKGPNGQPLPMGVVSSNFHVANCEADHCKYGMEFVSDATEAFKVRNTPVNHTGQVANFTAQGGGAIGLNGAVQGFPGSVGIRTTNLDATAPGYNRVHFANTRVSILDRGGVEVNGANNYFTFDGLWVDTWDTGKQSLPGVYAALDSTVVVGETNGFTDGLVPPNVTPPAPLLPCGGRAGVVFVHPPLPDIGESVLGASVTLTTNGNWQTLPGLGFTAKNTGIYLITLSARGATKASTANSSIIAQLTRNASPVTSAEMQVVWAETASNLAVATASRSYRLNLATGDAIGVRAVGYFAGGINSYVASDTTGRTSVTWEQVSRL